MHPAFSVIFFTVLSGAGYGLMAWLGALALLQHGGVDGAPELPLRALGLGLLIALLAASAGLLSSTAHLGKPLRAWRAFSQWRTSWLSREGVMAVLTYAPALALLAWLLAASPERALPPAWPALAGAALTLCALLTVACTAMIYASLPPIPAWRHPLVVPVYLAFALLSGAALLGALPGAFAAGHAAAWAVALLAPLTGLLKWRYWLAIDRDPLPFSHGDALGLPGRRPSVFERPHTQDNYLTREMGYVLARKHAAKLRWIGAVLFAAVPLALALAAIALPVANAPLMAAAALSVLLGAVVERWLFFAQARHLVTLYY
ncbi:dimethyl sulfoxide reductase anchor subunit family protein [Lysobacter enzymogenes]|uniref:dimethyl sulfoxide reductase anchor subunit family protein n=1 Tax=Lysobacter enzymogenes TaxID=69 RepID=UPI001A968679|nr:DmsC/YnfH family molybdoenzyme membrane anchor subunit [Lysobacter enzymogenes]QQP94242.1 dimethyl sulfoxide reductase anchor subunit [Lysobacter enzymogenes]